jgi:hypothetical protein
MLLINWLSVAEPVGLDILLINFGYSFVYTEALNWLVDMFRSNVNVLHGLGFAD